MSELNNVKFLTANLLPYRELEKKEQKKQLAILSSFAFVVGIFISMLISGYFLTQIGNQTNRNRYLSNENSKLDKELETIKELRIKLDTVLARKGIVENLQLTRSDTVNILNNIIKTIPEGVYLKTITQKGDNIVLIGITRSQAKVASFLNSLEESDMSKNVKLGVSKSTLVVPGGTKSVVKSKSKNTQKKELEAAQEEVFEFSLSYDIERKPKFIEESKKKKATVSKNPNDKGLKKDADKGINLEQKNGNKSATDATNSTEEKKK